MAKAQNISGENMRFYSNKFFGLNGGYKISNTFGDVLLKEDVIKENYHSVYAFYIGVEGVFDINNLLGIKGGVVWGPQGLETNTIFEDITLKKKIIRNYIELPITLNLKLSKSTTFLRSNLFAGPQVGFLINADEDILEIDNQTNISQVIIEKQDVTHKFNKVDFGFTLGSSFDLNLTYRLVLSFNLRGYLGLSNINNIEKENINFINTKNLGLFIGTSLLFGN
ncbi:outer membrane beta-barrel protein [Flexithrix dorotheae]|uniref:outer membrane beta-barrel protein n=1 Tax=Flexithrix dorotheae TaxID=70993 RepID=UPI0012F7BABB|nr:outer membrane beta-barrel protein [Flexithrix dorotheae]